MRSLVLVASLTLGLVTACGESHPGFGLNDIDVECDGGLCLGVSTGTLDGGGRYRVEVLSEDETAVRYTISWTGSPSTNDDAQLLLLPMSDPLDGRAVYVNGDRIDDR